MESSLHRALKERRGLVAGGRCEVVVDGFRIDAVDPSGVLIEIQSAPLSALPGKLAKLLPTRAVRVVKPIAIEKRVVRRARRTGPDLSSRMSPKRGSALDAFEELVGIARLFPDPNLTIEIVGVSVAEIRSNRTRRRWRSELVLDRELIEVGESIALRTADDLWRLFDVAPEPGEAFTTRDLARITGRSLAFAQRVAYCLRHSGAAVDLGKASRHRLYARAPMGLEVEVEALEASHVGPGLVPT